MEAKSIFIRVCLLYDDGPTPLLIFTYEEVPVGIEQDFRGIHQPSKIANRRLPSRTSGTLHLKIIVLSSVSLVEGIPRRVKKLRSGPSKPILKRISQW